MEFFDCNLCFGAMMVPPPRIAENVQALIEEMDFCGISEGLVRHAAQRDDSPVTGNELLSKEIRGFKRLHGTWAILPHQTGELKSPEEFMDRMKAHNIHALWAFPTEHKYLMTRTAFGPFYDLMIERHIPLFISITESCGGISGWYLIEHVLAESPDLTLVVTDHGSWGQDRFFRPLMEKYEHLYIDTSRYELDGGIKAFCNKYGPDRLLFGTGFPEMNMGGALLTLAQADITTKEREAIAAGNLKKLLKRVRL